MALWLVWLACSWCIVLSTALTVVEDTDESIRYSNSGPAWRFCYWYNGGGRAGIGWHGANMSQMSKVGWHEAYGAGASVSFTFTGTRVMLTGGLCKYFWPLTLNIFIDEQQIDTFTYNPPMNTSMVFESDWNYGVTIYDAQNLSPGQHTFRATSVGDNTLFTVDTIQYEPSAAGSSSASGPGSVSSAPATSDSTTTSTGSFTSSPSLSSFHTSTVTGSALSTQYTPLVTQLPVPTDSSTPVVSQMDIQPSDSRIVYHPRDAWTMEQNAKRAPACLSGTMRSNTTGSSLAFNFTASAIQLYTVSGSSGGRFRVAIDGEDKGTFDTYDAASNFTDCKATALVSLNGLDSGQHTIVLTVEDASADMHRKTIEFVGFRMTSASVSSPVETIGSSSKPDVGAIVGGVVGAIALISLVTLAILFLRKQRRQEEEEPEPESESRFNLATDGSGDNLLVHRPPIPYKGQRRATTASLYIPGGAGQGTSSLTSESSAVGTDTMTSGYPESSQASVPPRRVLQPNDSDGMSTLDRRTYRTLPSYHERVVEGARGRGRDLSEADINAISRRLREVMEQSGGVDMQPPRELVNQLVEEQLGPREDRT